VILYRYKEILLSFLLCLQLSQTAELSVCLAANT
jgi:hypothetical protein